jgi:hypothetical protein
MHKPESNSRDSQGGLTRLARTPLADLLRGRISGRMDARHVAARADLPPELTSLVYRTAHSARVRHREQHEMAEELSSWLQQGLAAGESADVLAKRFGNPAELSPLLRWAAVQRRSRLRRVMRRVWQVAVVAVVGALLSCAFLVGRYELGRPKLARDYLSEINRLAKEVPIERRAWPLYRQALMELEDFPDDDAELNEQAYVNDWPQIERYLKRNRPAFELARRAANKPRMGFWYGNPEDEPWLRKHYGEAPARDPQQQPLFALNTPHLDELARFRRLLLADSRRAVHAGEADVFLSNVQTLLGMAGHLRDGAPTMLTELRAFACFGTSLQLTGMMLADHPALLTDEQLVDLAHRIATFSGGGTLRARLDGEQLLFEDLLQRIYTDDGNGDGHLTREGYRMWARLDEDEPLNLSQPIAGNEYVEASHGAFVSLFTASRKDVSYLAERLTLRFQAERAGPLWEWDASSAEEHVLAHLNSPYDKQRYWPVLYVFPGFRHIALRGEVLTQQRDATLTAIGLQLYHRRHDAWPGRLSELTPFPLPRVPQDRFSGKPLCYRLVDGLPLLYSTGMDRDDDGGRPHRMGNSLAERWEPWTKVSQPPRLANDGFGNLVRLGPKFDWDWILWPPPKAPAPSPGDDADEDRATE